MGGCPSINSIYVQYPQQKSPSEIWFLAEWQELNYGGAFFRSNGGNASSFITSNDTLIPQDECIKKHTTGNMSANATGKIYDSYHEGGFDSSDGNLTSINGDSSYSGTVNNLRWLSASSKPWLLKINVEHTHTYGNDNDNPETRPINYTIKIWKRIA